VNEDHWGENGEGKKRKKKKKGGKERGVGGRFPFPVSADLIGMEKKKEGELKKEGKAYFWTNGLGKRD